MREACPFSDCYPWVWFVVRVFSKKKGRKIQIIIELFEHNNIYLQGIDDNNNHVTSSISVQNKWTVLNFFEIELIIFSFWLLRLASH